MECTKPNSLPALRGTFSNAAVAHVDFGSGCIGELGERLERDGVRRAVVLTGPSLAHQGMLLKRLTDLMGPRCVGVFSQTKPHNPVPAILTAATFARDHHADAIVSFGGSSQNEAAKAVAWALAENIETGEGFDAYAIRFHYPEPPLVPGITGKVLPIYAVPTTLSAGEFTNIVGITDPNRNHKYLLQDAKIAARAVLLDPDLTVATPAWLWLSSGVKAIDHCVEALLSLKSQPMTDALALHALATLFHTLPKTKATPNDMSARVESQVAAWLSVAGLGNVSLGLSHGIGHQIGAVAAAPHGYTSCVMLQHVLRFNHASTAERQTEICARLGLETDPIRNDTLADAVLHLVRDKLNLPWRLRDIGVAGSDLGTIAAMALRDPIVASNPRHIGSTEEIRALLEAAW